MALREFNGKLDATPKLKEFTGALDGESQSIEPTGDPMGSMSAEILAAAAPRQRSVLQGIAPDPTKFDFSAASHAARALDDTPAPKPAFPVREAREFTPAQERSVPRAIADTVLGLYQGTYGMAKGVTDNINAGDNPVSKFFETVNKGADRLKSDDLRDQQAKRDFEIYAAKKNGGEVAAARAAFNSLFTQPAAGLDVVARGAGSVGPTIGLGMLGAGTKVMGTVNALSNAGDAASQTADVLRNLPASVWQNDGQYQELISKGIPHEEAVALLAPIKALPAQAAGALTGLVSGSTGLEKVIAGTAVGNSLKQRAGRALIEWAGELAETLVPQAVGNATVGGIDGQTKITEGLGQAAIDTLAGTVPGAALSARHVPVPPVAPSLPPSGQGQSPAAPTLADYQSAVQKIFGTTPTPVTQQAPVSEPQAAQVAPLAPEAQPSAEAPPMAAQSLADLIASTATQDSPLNAPKLTPVADDIQLDKEPVADGTANDLHNVDSSDLGSGPLDADPGMAALQRVRDAGQLDLTGNAATQPEVRATSLESNGQISEQVAPANTQPAGNVAASIPFIPSQAKTITGHIGQEGQSIDEGGIPFKTKAEAQKAKKLQPLMRVKQVKGGFVLADKTPAQLAAEEKAAKRIRGASSEAGSKGKPMAAHEFIASRGGMAPSERSNLGIEGNIKIGNRWLFAGSGKGMTIAQATEALKEYGYLKEDSERAAYDLIKRSVSNPQYTDEGWEHMAELEHQTQFQDYLASQQEAAQEADFDPFAPLDDFGLSQEDDAGFEQASPELQTEVAAYAAQLDALGIDAESILERIAVQYPHATQDEYYEHAKDAFTQAIAEATKSTSSGNAGQDGGEQGNPRGQIEAPTKESNDQLISLADKLLANATIDTEEFTSDSGEKFTKKTEVSNGRLNKAQFEQWREIMGLATHAMPVNDETQNTSITLTGKNVGDGRNYRATRVTYTPLAEQDGLTSYTPQDIEDRLAKLEQAEQERKRLDREAEQNAKAEREAKDIADRQRASSDNFQLGQSAEDSLSGQQDIFSAPATEEAQVEPAPEATPAAAPAKPARKRKESTAELRAKLEDHFAVGNIIKSDYWKTNSRVLSFDWNGGNWSVTVEGVGKRDGEWVSTSSPRTHSTMFSAKDEVIERSNKPVTQAETPTEAQDKIADFGQKIGGARKDVWTSFKDQLGEVVDDDIALQPLSKVWPQPDYQALLDNGTDPWTVAFIRAARDEIPAKPRQSYKVKRWAEQVKSLRSMASSIMAPGDNSAAQAKKLLQESRTLKPLQGRVELYLEVGHDKSLDGITMDEHFYSLYSGEKNVTKWVIEQKAKSTSFGSWPRTIAAGNTKEEVLTKFKEMYAGMNAKADAKKQVTFDIYSKHRVDGFFVGKKLGRNYIDLAGPFATVKEARTYKAESQAELVDKLEKAKEIPRERRDTNKPRVGEDMRNGQDVTPQMFGAAFGFRGVEFGNWVAQGRRQQDLNDAYDALMDMAAVLEVPPKAISLNGELGLAFGARGSGGVSPAAAHYEPDMVVINLTKKNGAGSLGHEWWHALDNYFSRKRNKADGMMTDATDVKLASIGSKYLYQDKGVRKEMVDAYGVVMKAINSTAIKARSAQLDGKRSKDYWTTDVEMSARAFESYLIAKLQDQSASNDYLANIVDPETWKAMAALGMQMDDSYPYPTADEIPAIRAGFDEFFSAIETRDSDKGVEIYSTSGKGKGVNISERLTPSAIEDEISQALAKFAHKPVIRVLDTAVGVLPGASDSDGISGALHNSSIYLFRDFLHSRVEVQRTFFHELLHYGLRRFLTKDQFIAQMAKLYERDSFIKNEADAWVQTEVGQRTKATHGEEFSKARGVDETLAIFAEENRSGTLDKPVLERVRSVVTKWLAQLADFFGLKKYAADLRSVKNDEAHALINEIFGKIEVDAKPATDTWNDMADVPFSMKGEEQQADQTDLDLGKPKRKFEPINAKDAFSVEVNAAGRKQWVAGRKVYDRMAAYATDYLGQIKMADNKPEAFKQMLRQFRVDQNKATENAKRIAETGMELTPEQRVLLSDMIENQAKVADVPPQEMVELAASITAALDVQAQELVELGMLSEDRLVKDYLPRLYRTPLVAKLTNKAMLQSWFTKARLKIRGARLQSRGLVNEVPVNKVELAQKFGWKISSLADGEQIPQDLFDSMDSGKGIPSKYNGTTILMWRDFTEDERKEMGEVRDGVLRYAMGYVETQRDVAIGRLFKSISSNSDLAKVHNPGGWVQVPNVEVKGAPGTKTYGSLAGMYVEPQVADSLKRNTQPKGVLMQAYDTALNLWKEGKTVWNPVSHGNNVVSNIFVMHFAGLNPANPANWRNTVREYRTKGEYYKEAVDKGLFGTEWATLEIQNLLMPDLADMSDIESVATSRVGKVAEFLKKTGKPVSWYREKMQSAYEFEDQFFKLMIYADRRKAGMSPDDAVTDTERYIFNYADMPEGVELIKRTYSPFFAYTYKAVPMLIHTAMTRPDRLLAPIALLAGANWLGYLFSGGDEDKERKGLPEYMQGRSAIGTHRAIRMPFNVEGKPAFMDVTRRVPLGDLFDVSNQTNGLPVPAPMMPSHPMLTMTAAIAWNVDTFSGKDLVKKSDTSWEAAQTRAGYIYKQLTPNAPFVPGSFNFNKLMDSAA